MNVDRVGDALLFASVAGCIIWAIRERKRRTEALAAFEDHLDALRSDGLGVLVESDTPIFDATVDDIVRDASRYIATEWWLLDQNKGQR